MVSTNRSASTTKLLGSRGVEVLKWLAKTSDLNIAEIVRGLMARGIYRAKKQYTVVT